MLGGVLQGESQAAFGWFLNREERINVKEFRGAVMTIEGYAWRHRKIRFFTDSRVLYWYSSHVQRSQASFQHANYEIMEVHARESDHNSALLHPHLRQPSGPVVSASMHTVRGFLPGGFDALDSGGVRVMNNAGN